MHSKIILGVTALTLAQSAYAGSTIIAAIIGATGAIIGGAISTADKRSVPIDGRYFMRRQGRPEGVPEEEYHRCEADMVGASVTATGPIGNNGIQADGVPASCMNLATVLVGNPVDGPYPTACGSACLLYDNLTPEQYEQFRQIFVDSQA